MAPLALCSCISFENTAAVDPFLDAEVPGMATAELSASRNEDSGRAHTGQIQQVGFSETEQAALFETETDTGPQGRSGIRLAAHTRDDSGKRTELRDRDTSFSPAEPRIPIVQVGRRETDDSRPGVLTTSVEDDFDEYLFDGGDRAHPVHYDDLNRLGLDTEDTVVEYTDHTGKEHVKPTNRVAIYAPRFGAVRTISAPSSDVSIRRVAGARHAKQGVGMHNRLASIIHNQRESADGVRVRSRGSELDSDDIQVVTSHQTALAGNENIIRVMQNLTFVKTGRLNQTEGAYLAYGLQAAAVWTRDQSPVIIASDALAQEVRSPFKPNELIGREDRRRKGELRIVKLADKKTAQPGDIITFVIRYDNIGQRDLNSIRIIDNLTPRLEYVKDSATSDRAGRLVVDDNDEGSLILKFIVDKPLPGGEGGVMTFKAKVR